MCRIIYEDNHLLIVEKPPNLLTQGDETGDRCLLDVMKQYVKQIYSKLHIEGDTRTKRRQLSELLETKT